MFNRLRDAQNSYIEGSGNFVAFEFCSGEWYVNIGGLFNYEELNRISNLLKTPTSKKKVTEARIEQRRLLDDE